MKHTNKYKLILRSIGNMEEKVLFTYNAKVLILCIVSFVGLLFCLSFLFFNTIFSLWVNPYHYYGIDAKKMEEIQKNVVDLETKARQNDLYIKGIQEMLSVGASISVEDINNINYDDDNFENKSNLKVASKEKRAKLHSPFNGNKIKKYGDKTSTYPDSIVLRGHSQAPITAVANGFVLSVEFSEKNKLYSTIIQHENGIVVVFRHSFAPKVAAGDKISAHDIIAVVPKYTKDSSQNNDLIVSMYIDGENVNPENHIKF